MFAFQNFVVFDSELRSGRRQIAKRRCLGRDLAEKGVVIMYATAMTTGSASAVPRPKFPLIHLGMIDVFGFLAPAQYSMYICVLCSAPISAPNIRFLRLPSTRHAPSVLRATTASVSPSMRAEHLCPRFDNTIVVETAISWRTKNSEIALRPSTLKL